jgi:hypothetical protein
MAHPILRTFNTTKDQVIKAIPQAAEGLGMHIIGYNRELEMLSFGKKNDTILHAHIVAQENQSTKVAIAPALSDMKDRPQSDVPKSTIENILNNVHTILERERNR